MSSSQNSIRHLEPREHVRLRPGMYIGGIDAKALHHMVFEVLHYMVEQVYLKNCDHLWIELHPDNRISIRDNSAGISVEPLTHRPLRYLETLLQFVGMGYSQSKLRVGMHGIGLSVINGLCEEFIVDNCREGVLWQQTYYEGKPYTQLIPIAEAPHLPSGTTFTLIPDFTILERNEFDLALIEKRAQEVARQLPYLTIEVRDLRQQPYTHSIFHYPEGLKTLVQELNARHQTLHEVVHFREKFRVTTITKFIYEFEIEIAFQFSDRQDCQLLTYTNTVEHTAGGTHIEALKAGLTKCLGIDGRRRSTVWKKLSQGLTIILALFHNDIRYDGNHSRYCKIMNPEIYEPIVQLMTTWHDSQAIARIKAHYAQQYPKFADILG